MADPIKPTPAPQPPGEPPRTNEKLQTLSKNLLAGLYMLVRSVKIYDPENGIFVRPLNALLESANLIVAKDGKLDLTVASGSFYVNGQLVRVDQGTTENMKYLVAELEARKVGGFNLQRPTTLAELKNFISIFAKDQSQEVEEDGVAGRKLTSMKLARWSKIKEKLDKKDDSSTVDRKKYALTLYARAIFFVDHHLKELDEGKAGSAGKAARLVQDLVDISYEQRSQFLGMTSNGEGGQALTYHLVNTALLAIAFGMELGLDKTQLKELGLTALFSESGLFKVSVEHRLRLMPEQVPPEGQAQLMEAKTFAATAALMEPGASRLQFMRAVSSVQMHQPFGKPVRNAQGRISMVIAQGDLLLFPRLVAICSYYDMLTSTTSDHGAYGPVVALDLMWNAQRHRFDQELLAAFMRVMAQQPIKVMGKGKTVDLIGV